MNDSIFCAQCALPIRLYRGVIGQAYWGVLGSAAGVCRGTFGTPTQVNHVPAYDVPDDLTPDVVRAWLDA